MPEMTSIAAGTTRID